MVRASAASVGSQIDPPRRQIHALNLADVVVLTLGDRGTTDKRDIFHAARHAHRGTQHEHIGCAAE
jgi:hypothetical protein